VQTRLNQPAIHFTPSKPQIKTIIKLSYMPTAMFPFVHKLKQETKLSNIQ